MTGYSRGKLYRTKLVKTPAGYVAQNQLIACLNMLAADVCVAPQRLRRRRVHSGGPDWGSGPNGEGKLFQIRALQETPRPVVAWAQNAREVRVAFDAPLTIRAAGRLAELARRSTTARPSRPAIGSSRCGPATKSCKISSTVRAASWKCKACSLVPIGKTLILATAAHPTAANYALALKGLGRPATAAIKSPQLPQLPETDLAYSLEGVSANWQGPDAAQAALWLPHLDTQVSRELTAAEPAASRVLAGQRPARHAHVADDTRLGKHAASQGAARLAHRLSIAGGKSDRDFSLAGSHLTSWPAGRTLAAERTASRANLKCAPSRPPLACRSKFRCRRAKARPSCASRGRLPKMPASEPFPLRRFMLPWAPTDQERAAGPGGDRSAATARRQLVARQGRVS